MKVLMQNRSSAFSAPGGDTVQMVKTKEYLEKLGVSVDISLDRAPELRDYDLVHVFNMQDGAVTHSYYQVINAKRQRTPVALSTIYWNFDELKAWEQNIDKEITQQGKLGLEEKINSLLRRTVRVEIKRLGRIERMLQEARQEESIELTKSQQIACLLLSTTILPNAQAELDRLIRDFDVTPNSAHIVPNAADSIFEFCDGAAFTARYGVKDVVLCVGRIDSTKNQLALIRAMKGCGVPLVLIGKPGKHGYVARCREEADKDVIFLEHMPHDSLRSAYGAAKVHVLPSWRETPGLVSLEAGLAGCNIVVTNRGTTEEYFGNLAYYCEPDDVSSIRNAVMKAYAAPRSATLAKHILANYTWEKAAEKTLVAYQAITLKGVQ